jgi:hypothetical protein
MSDEKTKHAGGRPRTETPETYSPEQLAQIDAMAEAQCKDTTIAMALGIHTETFRRQFRERTEQKRAIGKTTVMLAQYEGCKVRGTGGMSERCWWGKQHLDQKDRQDLTSDDGALIVPGIVFIGQRPKQEGS